MSPVHSPRRPAPPSLLGCSRSTPVRGSGGKLPRPGSQTPPPETTPGPGRARPPPLPPPPKARPSWLGPTAKEPYTWRALPGRTIPSGPGGWRLTWARGGPKEAPPHQPPPPVLSDFPPCGKSLRQMDRRGAHSSSSPALGLRPFSPLSSFRSDCSTSYSPRCSLLRPSTPLGFSPGYPPIPSGHNSWGSA